MRVVRVLLPACLGAACAAAGNESDAEPSQAGTTPAAVRPGVEVFVENPPEIVRGKRVGLITNHSGRTIDGKSTIDALYEHADLRLVALFAPEHGIRGTADAGDRIESGRDEKTGLPVHSLYGDTQKPTPEMLRDVDVLVYDIQDVGVRQYTYESTLALAMEAAAEAGIPVIVLDRPNPVTGTIIEGNILEPGFESFIGIYPVLSRHGMTVGELARMYNEEQGIGADLTVVPAEGWRRDMWFDETGLPWVDPSPNLRRLEAAIHYPGTVFFEAINVAEGRGTDAPFEQVGAPWLRNEELAAEMNALNLPGIRFEPIELAVAEGARKYPGARVNGVRFVLTDRDVYRPLEMSLLMIEQIRRMHPDEFEWRGPSTREPHRLTIERHAGTARLHEAIEAGTVRQLLREWERDQAAFDERRARYLLYP
ncbi:MAG: exo-beta-N-acetylmuramidase NamZ family protein [Longimicrobiales bacterium]